MFVVLSGTTCSGKSAISDELVQRHGFARVTTTTSRPKRAGEVDGWTYNFVSQNEFDALKDKGVFLETNKHGSYEYGLQLDKIASLPKDRNAVLIVEPNGYKKIKRYLKANDIRFLGVFVDAEIKTRIGRLLTRSSVDLGTRLEAMIKVESHWINEIDLYDMLIQNDSELDSAIEPILDYAKRAKHLKIA